MDILKAAKVGDVSFLRKAYEENVGDLESYFLGRTVKEMMSYPDVSKWLYHGHSYLNFLQLAVWGGHYSFLCEALEILKSHPTLIIHLICQTNDWGRNSLHHAVEEGNIYVVKLIVHAYVTAVASAETCEETLMPPWLWLSERGRTPLYTCFVDVRSNEGVKSLNEGIAMYLVLQDQRLGRDRYPPKHECSTFILDRDKRSILYTATEAGWSLLVEHILTSDLPYNLNGVDFEGERHTPLHYASKCNAKVSKLLLEKHPELINVHRVKSVLHAAVEDGATWLVKLMLVGDETPVRTWIKACRRLMWHKNYRGETPLHISARQGSTEIAELIIQAYYSTLHPSYISKVMLFVMDPTSYQKMLESDELEKLSKVLPELVKEPVKDLKTILTEAAERGEDWLVTLCLESDEDLLMESAPAWKAACENGCVSTLITFISKFGDQEFIRHCRSSKQTPLHHIKLKQYGEYMELLKNPMLEVMANEIDSDGSTPLHRAIQRDNLELAKALLQTNGIDISIEDKNGMMPLILLEDRRNDSHIWHEQYIELLKNPRFKELKNQIDSDGATPLHRAIQRDDLELTKTLLEIKGINVTIKNKNGKAASDLLEDQCKSARKWGKMCREIEQNETVENLKFVFRSIAFEGMQNTLSLVAALVATITFAAGITVPGGVDSSNGEAVLSTRAAFLVFSVSNTIAMCSSIMVLFLLLGPMMWDPQPSLFYVKLSLYLLLLSLGGTMLAFMTGVYSTMINKVRWNAIFILVSCSLTLFVSCIILLSTYSRRFKYLHKLFKWLTCNTIHHRIFHICHRARPSSVIPPVSIDIATTTTIQSQPGSENRIVSQVSGSLEQTQNREVGQFSRTSVEAPVDVKIEIQST